MTLLTTPISVGPFSAEFCWNSHLQTYQVSIALIEQMVSCNVTYGSRFAEFITPDSLLNYLRARGYEVGSTSVEKIFDLRDKVSSCESVPELIGYRTDKGHTLFIATPSGQYLQILPLMQHNDYKFSWGDTSVRTIETARRIHTLLWNESTVESSETFALSFVYEYLKSCEEVFSLSLHSICDWYASDAALQTSLSKETVSAMLLS